MNVAICLGTRPEILKNYPIVQALRRRGIAHTVLFTGQHKDPLMHEPFFDAMGYRPDHTLAEYAFGRAVDWARDKIVEKSIDTVLVNGDTAAALVGAIAGMYSDRRVVHVEAGLRSFDPEMYEERNRIMVDAVAHDLLCYTDREARYLAQQRELRGRVAVVGNPTIDVVHDFAEEIDARRIVRRFAFVTLHRKELTDRPERMAAVAAALAKLAHEIDVVFPVHPRTRDAMSRIGIDERSFGRVELTAPIGPFESLAHIKHAAVVVTDSGCVQEECAILETPCVTVRENTERRITLELGINRLSGFETDTIVAAVREQMAFPGPFPTIYGHPGVGERIVDLLLLQSHGGDVRRSGHDRTIADRSVV